MRLLHTADWHLGKLLNGRRLTEDQAHVLDQVVQIAVEFRPDVFLVAGDIFDRPVPAADAVELLDDTLFRLHSALPNTRLVLTVGNHDGPERLDLNSRLLSRLRVHLHARASADPEPLELQDEFGPVRLLPLPYLEPLEIRRIAEAMGPEDPPEIRDHGSALQWLLDRYRARWGLSVRTIVSVHAYVVGGEESESERRLAMGGTERVPADVFDGFAYVALGHLHRPQTLDRGPEALGRIRYSGSLLQYSFSEVNDSKSVLLVELDEAGRPTSHRAPLIPRHRLVRITGEFSDLVSGEHPTDDYVELVIPDRGPIVDLHARLRAIYPNLLHVRIVSPESGAEAVPDFGPDGPLSTLDPTALFPRFWEQVTGSPMGATQEAAFAAAICPE